MPRKLLLAACAAAVVVPALVSGSAQALAHERIRNGWCVVARPGALLYPPYSGGCYGCGRPRPQWVRPGRAFRVLGHEGGFLKVEHLQARGWLEYGCARPVDEDYCTAAGI
jgi:hypothetical protein